MVLIRLQHRCGATSKKAIAQNLHTCTFIARTSSHQTVGAQPHAAFKFSCACPVGQACCVSQVFKTCSTASCSCRSANLSPAIVTAIQAYLLPCQTLETFVEWGREIDTHVQEGANSALLIQIPQSVFTCSLISSSVALIAAVRFGPKRGSFGLCALSRILAM